MAWLIGWDYRKSHVINAQAGAGTLYQTLLKVYYGSGTDGTETVNTTIAGKVYCDSKCKTDFGDLRFTDDDGSTELDYWIEEKVDSNYALVWVEVADSLESSNVTIYIYYGKADATTTSNGDNTFRLFDDFLGDSLDGTKWDGAGTGTVVVGSGVLTVTSGTTLGNHCYVTSDNVYAVGVAVEARLKVTFGTNTRYAWHGMTGVVGSLLGKDYANSFRLLGSDANFSCGSGDGTNGELIDYGIAKDTNFHRASVKRSGTTVSLNLDSTSKNGTYPTSTDRKVTINAYCGQAGNAGQIVVDWIAVRKFVSPEPVHGAWGEEQESIMVTTLDATNRTISSAQLNALASSPELNIVECGFDWGTESGVYTDEWTEEGTWSGEFSFNYTTSNFQQGTTYYFRAKMKDENNVWYYGEELSFVTLIRLYIITSPSLTVDITVDGIPYQTPYYDDFEKNDVVTVVLTQSEPFIQGEFKYEFKEWEDTSVNKTRNITMVGTTTITVTAYYRKLFQLMIKSDETGTEFELGVGV